MKACYCALLRITAILSITFISGIESTNLTVTNNCPYTIWPAAVSNFDSPPLGTTGFALGEGASSTIQATSGWAGRIWARTFCSTAVSGRFGCLTGDCGMGQVSCNGNSSTTPASLVEFQLNGYSNSDYYDVSLVDGFNLPVMIAPQTEGCQGIRCPMDQNVACSSGGGIGCKSDLQLFKSVCPHAYANPLDSATFSCPTGGNYVITFCPSPDFTTQPEYMGMICIL